jgi:glycosyltransferase involved in cell wall biosynthesis
MKILVVHEVNYLKKIIYEFQILPEILAMLGHEVTIIDYDDSWKTSSNGDRSGLRTRIHEGVHRAYPQASVTVRRPGMIRLPLISRVSGAVSSGLEIYQFVRNYSPDVVLLYAIPTVGLQTLLAARKFNVPVIFRSIDILNQLVPRPLVPATKMLERYIYNRVDLISTVTVHLKNYVLGYGVPESRVRVLPSGVDTEMFSPGLRNNTLFRGWGIAPADPVFLFMGTIYRFSGLDHIISGFPRLLSRHPQAKLLIVGCGEDEERLKALAADAGLSGQIIFGGLQPYSALPDIIRSSDICINPFELNAITRDILPTKLFQYLACGKPVIATELPGTIPFLAGEEHGMVHCSLDAFIDEMDALLDNPSRRERLGQKGTAVAQGKYEWRCIAESMLSWMRELVEVKDQTHEEALRSR